MAKPLAIVAANCTFLFVFFFGSFTFLPSSALAHPATVQSLNLSIDRVSPSYLAMRRAERLGEERLEIAQWINHQLKLRAQGLGLFSWFNKNFWQSRALDLGVFKVNDFDLVDGLEIKYPDGISLILKNPNSRNESIGFFVLDLLERHETTFNPLAFDAQVEAFRTQVINTVLSLYPNPKSAEHRLILEYLAQLPESQTQWSWFRRWGKKFRRSLPQHQTLGHEYLAYLKAKWDLIDSPERLLPKFTAELRESLSNQGLTKFIEPTDFQAKIVLSMISREIKARGLEPAIERIAKERGRIRFTVDKPSQFSHANERVPAGFTDYYVTFAGEIIAFRDLTHRTQEQSSAAWDILLIEEWKEQFFEGLQEIIKRLDPVKCEPQMG